MKRETKREEEAGKDVGREDRGRQSSEQGKQQCAATSVLQQLCGGVTGGWISTRCWFLCHTGLVLISLIT